MYNSTHATNSIAGYTGAYYEEQSTSIIGEKLNFILRPLFDLQSTSNSAFPITALGAVGVAIGLVPQFIKEGVIDQEIAVFTSMECVEWIFKYHVAMMDS